MHQVIRVLVLLASACSLWAQAVVLRGLITDQSGAAVPGASVTLTGSNGTSRSEASDATGAYTFTGIPSGDYTVQASAPQLVLIKPIRIALQSGTQTLNLLLNLAPTVQRVEVQANEEPSVSTDPAANAGALILRGHDL